MLPESGNTGVQNLRCVHTRQKWNSSLHCDKRTALKLMQLATKERLNAVDTLGLGNFIYSYIMCYFSVHVDVYCCL
jgi:hypothetical protein